MHLVHNEGDNNVPETVNLAPPPPEVVANPLMIEGLDDFAADTAQRKAIEEYIKLAHRRKMEYGDVTICLGRVLAD